MKKLVAVAVLLIAMPVCAPAQDANGEYHAQGYVFFAPDATKSSAVATMPFEYNATKGVAETFGFGADAFVYKGLGVGSELGYAGLDWTIGHNAIGVGSADVSYHLLPRTNGGKLSRIEPFVEDGYTLFFRQDAGVITPHRAGTSAIRDRTPMGSTSGAGSISGQQSGLRCALKLAKTPTAAPYSEATSRTSRNSTSSPSASV